MIRVCLPSGSQHGWGVAGTRITQELAKFTELAMPTDGKYPLLMAVRGPDFMPMQFLPAGPRNLGMAFIEQSSVAKDYVRNYQIHYTGLVCGSRWMKERMEQIGMGPCSVVYQGVDYDVFYPDPEFLRPDDSPFTVVSAGKFELRKSQDIVIAAMKVLMERHADVRLVAAWGNLWPETMRSMESSSFISYKHVTEDWKKGVQATLFANGIPLDRVEIVDMLDHKAMADVYRKAHVGLFPNRCEAGTNLCLMECIASGTPVIASHGTGHKDVADMFWISLTDGQEDQENGWWWPSSIDETIAALELAYSSPRDYTRKRGVGNALAIQGKIGWDKCAKELLGLLVD